MCFSGARLAFGWLVWMSGRAASCSSSVFPQSRFWLHVASVYLFSHQTSRMIIFPLSFSSCTGKMRSLCPFPYVQYSVVYCCEETHGRRWIRSRCLWIWIRRSSSAGWMERKWVSRIHFCSWNNLRDRCCNIQVILFSFCLLHLTLSAAWQQHLCSAFMSYRISK